MSLYKKWTNATGTKTYFAWRSMRRRCYQLNDAAYKNYGGRGISVCHQWRVSYDQFVSDIGLCPEGLSLDRIDCNGNYEPSNCRWATPRMQTNNKRNNHLLVYNGLALNICEWADKLGIERDTLCRRINVYKMPLDKALQEERPNHWRHGTRHGYEKYKCRCDSCRAAHNSHCRETRRKKNYYRT